VEFLAIVIGLVVCLVLAVIILKLRDRLEKQRRKEPAPRVSEEEYRQQLRHPKPEAITARFGWTVPESLVEVYRTHELVTEVGVVLVPPGARHPVDCAELDSWQPLDERAVGDEYPGALFPAVQFAGNPSSDAFLVPLFPGNEDATPVFVRNHDGDIRPLAGSIHELLSWERNSVEELDRRWDELDREQNDK